MQVRHKLPALATDDKDALKTLLGELEADELAMTAVRSDEIDALLSEAAEIEAEFPITAKLHESYDYVLVFTNNESDFAFLQTLCGVVTERSYKKTGVGQYFPILVPFCDPSVTKLALKPSTVSALISEALTPLLMVIKSVDHWLDTHP